MAYVRKAIPLPKQEAYEAQRVADAVQQNARPVDSEAFDGGKLFDVTLTAPGTTDVIHKLGKVPSGFVLAGTDQFVLVRQVSADSTVIRLEFSGSCAAKVMVY